MVVPASRPSTTPDVLVVGAGPSGLVAALSLLRNGVSVRIIEKSPEYRIGQRGAAITPRSLEAFKALGIVERLMDQSIPIPMLKVYELHGGLAGGKIFEMSPFTLPTANVPFPNIMCLGQNNLEALLREELEKCGVPVEHGTELITFSQTADIVSAKIFKNGIVEQAEYSWLIGADGARGAVRKILGLSFLGETSNTDNICVGDVIVHGLDHQFWHIWGEASTNILRPTEAPPLFSFIFSGKDVDRERLISDEGSIQQFLNDNISAPELKFGAVTWKSTYRPNIRMVTKMAEGRAVLVGGL
ncbi:FAD/NAD(P)-binding domain-containing protein [Marasmius fiardii PR-910]|nr:FAD/NAD(P)-binding domain-containing protein [Marasmius fiardii PR-910]